MSLSIASGNATENQEADFGIVVSPKFSRLSYTYLDPPSGPTEISGSHGS
jgi:hypothetical protein